MNRKGQCSAFHRPPVVWFAWTGNAWPTLRFLRHAIQDTWKRMDPNVIELIRPMMSNRLGRMWDYLANDVYFEILPTPEKHQMIAYELRRQHAECFDLRMAGDCWVWCEAIPYMNLG